MLTGARASAAAPSPSFTITATNVMMSSTTATGTGASGFTLTSVNGYAGSVRVGCNTPAPVTGVSVPSCDSGVASAGGAAVPAPPPIALTANESVPGTVTFFNGTSPCGNPCPAGLPRPAGRRLATGLALAGVLLFGFGLRRRAARWLTMTLLAVGSLAGIAGISACGSNSVVTPGTYTYTIVASDTTTNVSVTTSINVTVP